MPSLQGRRWVFTLNNPTNQERESLIALFNDESQTKYAIIGNEVGATGTPHIQGFVVFGRQHRLRGVKLLLGNRVHAELARGTSQQAAEYCRKDGDFTEYGTMPQDTGRRSDLEALLAWGDFFYAENGRPPNAQEIATEQPSAFLKYPRILELFRLRAPVPILEQGELRPWQLELKNDLVGEPDDRKIIFIVDHEGNVGKSWFQRWMLTTMKETVQLLGVGKRDDIAHTVDPSKTIFMMNVPRNGIEFLQYSVLEMLKDRMVYSPKYNSQMKIIQQKCHVVVFTNEDPDESRMTPDRFDIRYISL